MIGAVGWVVLAIRIPLILRCHHTEEIRNPWDLIDSERHLGHFDGSEIRVRRVKTNSHLKQEAGRTSMCLSSLRIVFLTFPRSSITVFAEIFSSSAISWIVIFAPGSESIFTNRSRRVIILSALKLVKSRSSPETELPTYL